MKGIWNKSGPDTVNQISHFHKVKIDEKKVSFYNSRLAIGMENYSLFQKFSYYQWPAWLYNSSVAETPEFRPLTPPLLFNNSMREGISFTNLLSTSELFIDPSGMLSPSYDDWSIEIWLAAGNNVFRPAEFYRSISIQKDPVSSIVTTKWTDNNFIVSQTIIGARTDIDEAIVEISADITGKMKEVSLLFLLRPYNSSRIGTISSARYDDHVLTVNSHQRIVAVEKPDFLLTGNGTEGDVDLNRNENPAEIGCKSGMATLGLAYRLKKGDNRFIFRISLDSGRDIRPGKINFKDLKKEFSDFVQLRGDQGFNISVYDTVLKNWFYGIKHSLINLTPVDFFSSRSEDGQYDMESLFFLSLGMTRMGFKEGSSELVAMALKSIADNNEKNITFKQVTTTCYAMAIFTDYYLHNREMEFLQKNHPSLKNAAQLIYNYSTKIKDVVSLEENSLDYNFTGEGHSYDLVLLSAAMSRFAYISRTMGIFGDESKFEKESDRLAALFLDNAVNSEDKQFSRDDFYCYNSVSLYPLTLKSMDNEKTEKLVNSIVSFYQELPVIVKSMGLDLKATLHLLNSMIYLKDPRVWDVLPRVMKIGSKRFSLPDYANPLTKHGCWGKGASKTVDSLLLCTLRNLLFLDIHDRLELFPIPKEEWFRPGSDIVIEKAPSRYGNISVRVVSTAHEIHVQFEDLPKYIPPDIMINFPFKLKIVKGDDFVLKKEFGTSFLINGWPSVVRFMKK